jgi:hypothetical protein
MCTIVHDFCMLEIMVKEADIDRIAVKRDTVLAYLSRRNFGRIPRPNRKLAMGPVWFERTVEEWEKRRKHG